MWLVLKSEFSTNKLIYYIIILFIQEVTKVSGAVIKYSILLKVNIRIFHQDKRRTYPRKLEIAPLENSAGFLAGVVVVNLQLQFLNQLVGMSLLAYSPAIRDILCTTREGRMKPLSDFILVIILAKRTSISEPLNIFMLILLLW